MAQARSQHAIIGTGASGASDTAIKECLLDVVDEDDRIGLIWKRPIPQALEWVYDFVIDNSVPFVMYYDEANTIPPKVFREAEFGQVQKSRNPELAALNAITGSGKVLFLWDDAENPGDEDPAQDLIEWVFDNIKAGTIVLELSNGLRPITAVGVQEKDLIDDLANENKGRYDDDEVSPLDALAADLPGEPGEAPFVPFSRDELLNMPAANVKRYGKVVGTEATTKSGIIDELYPLDPVVPHTVVTAPDLVEELQEDPALAASAGVTMMAEAIEQNEQNKTDDPHHRARQVHDEVAIMAFRRGLLSLGGPADFAEGFEDLLRLVIQHAPPSRERSLVITKLEEAHHWAVKSVLLTGELPEV